MSASDFWVNKKMDVQCSVFKLLLFQVLVAWCGAKQVAGPKMPEILVSDHLEAEVQRNIQNLIHTGMYSHRDLDPSALEVTRPVRVWPDGRHLSHSVEHTHQHAHARARRDLGARDHTMDHVLHYNLTVGGRELRIDLRPSVSFITPALVVERHTAGGRTRHRPLEESTGCHYTGEVRGQPGSRVAVSACNGLAGALWTKHGEYWIEPSNHISEHDSEGRAHVIFKREAVDKEAAWHRAKRAPSASTAANNRTPYNRQANVGRPYVKRQNSWSQERRHDKQRREYLEARHKQLEDLRRNPTEYRLHQMTQRAQEKTRQSMSSSVSRSQETGEVHGRRNKQNGDRRLRIKSRRRRKRSRNCATKQPPYQWNKKSHRRTSPNEYQYNKNRTHYSRGFQQRWAGQARRARSVSKPRHVEALLVADRSMTEFHNGSHLETYLLTIMNMVSSLYMDPSIGNYIKVVVVKIILVEEQAPGLEVSTNADLTLNSFCKWQHNLNPDNDDNPHHHDVAILITRQDICSQHDAPCSTLGVAHVAGMCKPDRSCSVNEDNGITLAHTITHELGHNFGLYHDTEKIGCHRREGSTLHIMTPIFEADTVQVAWSRCSKRDVTNFLDAGLGECLGDRPSQEEYVYPEVPAGVTYDAASQCHLQFGAEAQVCTDPEEICTHLWCLVNNTCKTMMRPAAPGTTCGQDMWCQNLKCVPRAPIPQPRDGGWGQWSEWSECSRTCGGGVSTQYRECNNPEPVNNGKYCIGERSRHKVCNTEACPIGDKSFREVQCEKYTNITHKNETFNDWVPYFDQDKPCELTCMPRNRNDIDMLGGFVADGTPCRQVDGARDLCIAGVCHKVGCDWVVDSEAEEDVCGVCGGDGSACKTVLGIYNKGTTKQSGFSEVAVIPKGSRNVKIEEKVSPGNYISIGSAKTKKFFMNGARNQTLTEYLVAGSHAIYERDRDWEKVRIPGPIVEDIKVYQRIYRGKHRNPGVTYQYTVDAVRSRAGSAAAASPAGVAYRLSAWAPCSVTCGLGRSTRRLMCVDERGREVEQQLCYHIEAPRHEALMLRCRQPPCRPAHPPPPAPATRPPPAPSTRPPPPAPSTRPPPARRPAHWWVGGWRPCDRACAKPGEEPTKRRGVYCVDKASNQVIDESACADIPRPINAVKCENVQPC